MKWVLVVTVLTIYAASIVFTYLVGHGLIYGYHHDVPESEKVHFGSVTASMFSLFELMNGDLSVAGSINTTPIGRLLFISFMIVSNWSILAILTSVVSDGMINTTNQIDKEEERMKEEHVSHEHTQILEGMFVPRDPDSTGMISERVWEEMLDDRNVLEELRECSSMRK